MRPRLLDLFCGAGGASMGYHQAGFEVVGVDIKPQPHYPFRFHQADAATYPLGRFDVIHASPPCHDHTPLSALTGRDGTGEMLAAIRRRLSETGLPWVIENVPGAPMRPDVVLCGSQFGLRTYRHRWFELSDPVFPPVMEHRPHRVKTSTKKRRACWDAGLNVSVTGDIDSTIGGLALGIDWMTGDELSQAIPPAYTRHIGEAVLEQRLRYGKEPA